MLDRIRKSLRRQDGGFTLVELIVVVAIVGILAAIAVPIFLKQTANAKEKADLATLTNAKTALTSYIAAEGGRGTTAPAVSVLTPYGWPADGASVAAITGVYSEITPQFEIQLTTAQSGESCKVTATTNPKCQ